MKRQHVGELVAARNYYGRHATGTVLLVDGQPEFHGKRHDAVRTCKALALHIRLTMLNRTIEKQIQDMRHI
jgi:hypothetical protein